MSDIPAERTFVTPEMPTVSAGPLHDNFKLLQQAEQLRQHRNFGRARSICESLLHRYPDYMGALHTLGLVFADQNDYDQALDCLVRAVMLNPRSWTTLTALSGVYLRLGAIEMALSTIVQAKAIKPHDANILVALGDVYRELREYELARDAYAQAVALDPSLVAAALGLGWCHENLGAHADAAAIFEGLIKRGMRLLEPIRALANMPASVVTIDLLAALDRVIADPSEDKLDFENSVPFFRGAAFDRAGRHAEAWNELTAANRRVFLGLQKNLPELSALRQASLAALRAHPGRSGRQGDGRHPVSLFILGPSGCGKTTVERLVGALPGVKRGYENPVVENAVRRTFQASNMLTVSVMQHLPAQLDPLFSEIYFDDLARRAGSAKVFTNTLSNCIHNASRLVSAIKNVRFVFVKRNVEDNLLRIFMRKYKGGNAYGYNLKAARDHILWYHEMMDLMAIKFPDIVRVITYEDTVANPAAVLSLVAKLCDLPIPDDAPPKITGDCGCAEPYRQFIARELNG